MLTPLFFVANKHARFYIVLIALTVCSVPLAFCQTLSGDNVVNQLEGVGFVEVSSSPQLKVFYRTFKYQMPEALKNSQPTDPGADPIRLTVYIEGDGAAWRVRQLPPSDPTPQNPISANLALADAGMFVAYMGRPCMYLSKIQLQECPSALWTDARFGKEALELSNEALNDLLGAFKKEGLFEPSKPIRLNLVGYSGGGVMAALLASQRSDVTCLATVASPLDIEVWTKLQKIAPLLKSFNPAFPDARLSQLSQKHWFGAQDRIVPPQALGRYRNWSPELEQTQVIQVIPNFNHRDFWVQEWPNLKEKSCLN